MHNAAQRGEKLPAEDVCASFSRAALEPLLSLAEKHLKRLGLKTLALAGGVAANGYLRGRAESLARKNGFKLLLPEKKLCTDNGAMVASQGYFLLAEKGVNCDLALKRRTYVETQRGQTVETLNEKDLIDFFYARTNVRVFFFFLSCKNFDKFLFISS